MYCAVFVLVMAIFSFSLPWTNNTAFLRVQFFALRRYYQCLPIHGWFIERKNSRTEQVKFVEDSLWKRIWKGILTGFLPQILLGPLLNTLSLLKSFRNRLVITQCHCDWDLSYILMQLFTNDSFEGPKSLKLFLGILSFLTWFIVKKMYFLSLYHTISNSYRVWKHVGLTLFVQLSAKVEF